jgi:hypothetical protein
MVAPEFMHEVRQVSVPERARLRVVIGVPQVKSIQATLAPWHSRSPDRPKSVAARVRTVDGFVALTLPRLGAIYDQVLAVFVQSPPRTPTKDPNVVGGDASYVWRLYPAPR